MMVATTSHWRAIGGSSANERAVEKRSLASIVRDQGPLSVADAVDITLDICDALANAHAHGVVHGDLGLHRVRAAWPRVPGHSVDLFALGENDSAAFAFRAAASAVLVAPEQRAGRAVDLRADVWAVGAMLHWMIAGAAPPKNSAPGLGKAPRALAACVEACLSPDPAKRPSSVDVLAETIASFSSAPAERFDELARRRVALRNASRKRTDASDLGRVLDRLDEAALDREVEAAADTIVKAPGSIVIASSAARSSAVFMNAAETSLVDDEMEIETLLAQPRYEEQSRVVRVVHDAVPSSTAPVVVSSDALPAEAAAIAAPSGAADEVRAALEVETTSSLRTRTLAPWMVGVVGALAALSVGVVIGMRLMDHAAPTLPPSAATSVVAAPRAPTPTPSSATTSPSVTPLALPDALEVTPASLPDARIATPASLPNAPRPTPPRAVAAPAPPPPAAVAPAADDGESSSEPTPSAIDDSFE